MHGVVGVIRTHTREHRAATFDLRWVGKPCRWNSGVEERWHAVSFNSIEVRMAI